MAVAAAEAVETVAAGKAVLEGAAAAWRRRGGVMRGRRDERARTAEEEEAEAWTEVEGSEGE